MEKKRLSYFLCNSCYFDIYIQISSIIRSKNIKKKEAFITITHNDVAARDELAKLEAEHAELGQKVTEQRRQLPWVPVEKEYEFDTEHGKKTLGDLFDGRSQLLAYNIMFGPDYELGACPGCTCWEMSSTPRACI